MSDEKDVTLWGITSELRAIEQALINNGGEIDEEKEQLMERLNQVLSTKVDGVVNFVRSQEDFVESIDKRIEELKKLKTKILNGMKRFDSYVLNCMDSQGVVKLEGQFDQIMIRKPAQVLEIVNEDDIPLEFLSVETKEIRKIDTAKIKELLKKGETVPGATLVFGKRSPTYKSK